MDFFTSLKRVPNLQRYLKCQDIWNLDLLDLLPLQPSRWGWQSNIYSKQYGLIIEFGVNARMLFGIMMLFLDHTRSNIITLVTASHFPHHFFFWFPAELQWPVSVGDGKSPTTVGHLVSLPSLHVWAQYSKWYCANLPQFFSEERVHEGGK